MIIKKGSKKYRRYIEYNNDLEEKIFFLYYANNEHSPLSGKREEYAGENSPIYSY
jgi:hypothetical protein